MPKTQSGNCDAYEVLKQSFESKDEFFSEHGAPRSKMVGLFEIQLPG
jgi:hypothetical protein